MMGMRVGRGRKTKTLRNGQGPDIGEALGQCQGVCPSV